jgi:mannose-1-phosphate guanylyltransferase/mannose-6-phosphate isomerase
MFVFQAGRYLAELGKFAPDILEASTAAYRSAKSDLDFVRIDKAAFARCRSESIDYAVMEKTHDAVVLPLDAGWSDVGSWSSLFDALPADEDGNVLLGDVLVHDTHDCYVHSTSRLVTAVGMDDHIIVETKDAVMVAPKGRVQDVKELVNKLKKSGRSESSLHREVFRPWGSYDSIDDGERFQVKRLSLKPGGCLSLQMHHHRAEHWIVVQGTARITCNDKTFLLSENESTYVPIGATHRIENPGKLALHIVEVRSGSYMGEDDIVRLQDSYGREGTSN